jgi:erythromycin esterase
MLRPAPTYVSLEEWVARESIPFSVDSSDNFSTAVGRVIALIGDSVELLGFGEALHGGEGILVLRNRLFQHLVRSHGFSAMAIESSFPRARRMNEYVSGQGSDSYDAVQETGLTHGFGKLEANRELVEWMRRYNADASHRVKLQFYGFDSPTEMTGTESPRQLLQVALDYLATVDAESAAARRGRIHELLGEDTDWENPAAMMDPSKSIGLSPAAVALRIETEELITELRRRRPEFTAKSDDGQYREAEHYASSARQFLAYHAGLARTSNTRLVELLGMRDLMMADNLGYITEQERGRGKVFAFGHNSHLKRGQAKWQLGPHALAWWPAGAQLHHMLGARYAAIGSAIGVSEENGIGQPEDGTLEAVLTASPGPARFISTHGARSIPVADIVTRSSSTRNSTYFPLTAQSFSDFDVLAVLDSTTYTRGGRPI